MAVNPKDTSQLRLDGEIRQIKEALKLSDERSQFEIVDEQAVRTTDLRRHLLHHKPQIVHFSGHGVGAGGLAFEDKNGHTKLMSTDSLTRLFRLCSGVECVLLNACHSVAQANAILDHVDHVIAMTDAIGDQAMASRDQRRHVERPFAARSASANGAFASYLPTVSIKLN